MGLWLENGFKIQKLQTQGGGREAPAPLFLFSFCILKPFSSHGPMVGYGPWGEMFVERKIDQK